MTWAEGSFRLLVAGALFHFWSGVVLRAGARCWQELRRPDRPTGLVFIALGCGAWLLAVGHGYLVIRLGVVGGSALGLLYALLGMWFCDWWAQAARAEPGTSAGPY